MPAKAAATDLLTDPAIGGRSRGGKGASSSTTEIAGESVHFRNRPARDVGGGVVVSVGVDVVGVEIDGAVSDELDPGDADVVGGPNTPRSGA